MQKIPSEVHGLIDYLAAPVLLLLPRMAKWPRGVTNLLTAAALGTTALSLLTRYELGLVKVIPFKTHLMADAAKAMLYMATPVLLQEQDSDVVATMVGLGITELAIVALTNPEPFQEDWANRLTQPVGQMIQERASQIREAVNA